jgi:hypothetical protein
MRRDRIHHLALGLLGLLLGGAAPTLSAAGNPESAATVAAAPVVPEYNAKAGYLLLFCRYVDFPGEAFSGPDAPFTIGVFGDNPFGDVLQRTVAGQRHEGRRIEAVPVRTLEEARRCHVVFFPRTTLRQAQLIEELRGAPVLTVVESPEGLVLGSAVAFVTEPTARGARLKFDVNLPATEAAHLRVSAPMLSAARKVQRTATVSETRSAQ